MTYTLDNVTCQSTVTSTAEGHSPSDALTRHIEKRGRKYVEDGHLVFVKKNGANHIFSLIRVAVVFPAEPRIEFTMVSS